MTLLEIIRAPRGARSLALGALCAMAAACSGDDGAVDPPPGAPGPTTGTLDGGPAVPPFGDGGMGGDASFGPTSDASQTTGDSGAVTGEGGAVTGDAEAGTPVPKHVPPCIDNDEDVVMIGDSYIDWLTHSFIADMRAEAGQQWPSYAVGGYSMATGGLGPIPEQLPQALEVNPNLKMIVMTGGGNDILVPDTGKFPQASECTNTPDAPTIPDCQAIVAQALDTALELMVDAADAGVTDVVYFFYPHIPGEQNGLPAICGPHPNEILDYALPMARDVCESALEVTDGRMKCHFVDMVPVFAPYEYEEMFAMTLDGVHPNYDGSKLMAKEIWRVMKAECLAQPSGSGCCIDN